MWLTWVFGSLAMLSLGLAIWQFLVAMRFPLHRRHLSAECGVRSAECMPPSGSQLSTLNSQPIRSAECAPSPSVTLLKPLKGCDSETTLCLQSWLSQDYSGELQVLFGVANADDPVCELVRQLIAAHPNVDAQLVICPEQLGANAKVSTLARLEAMAKHEVLIISDADVRVTADLVSQVVPQLGVPGVGLVNCFYRFANPSNLAMRLEAVATNADFWSQVLQAQSLKPLDFALGAVMATTRTQLEKIGGFAALVDYLADDYQLGHRIARNGGRIALSPIVVECWSAPMNWKEVWTHQLRWARTIRVCQPVSYFLSILNNGTLWALLFCCFGPAPSVRWVVTSLGGTKDGFVSSFTMDISSSLLLLGAWLFVRCFSAGLLQERLSRRSTDVLSGFLAPIYDLIRVPIWALSFIGNRITWRGNRFRVEPGGKLVRD